jgi:NADH:ubiquinone oxidoreductase subunit 5 (subunit L)/multisubunit Na+/H+ antiporter MnhA subunit
MITNEMLLATLVLLPGVVFALLALAWLLGEAPSERLVAQVTAVTYAAVAAAAVCLGWELWRTGVAIHTPVRHWFAVGDYHFELSLVADRLSWPLLQLTAILVGLVGVFSVRYLHRDRGYFRFFLLLHLFAFGALLVLAAGTFDLLLGGWELVGISSVLLIAFFDERREPVRNALRVFGYYRVADLGLLLAIYCLHSMEHTSEALRLFRGSWPDDASAMHSGGATLVGLLLLMAAAGKSAQLPFSGWLPRAMEGPTPSSAIFYGAISVHLGAYLLLRSEPILRSAPVAAWAVVAVGVATASVATVLQRAATDAKTSLAYASMVQLGIIFAEIGLGFPRVAIAHILGHAVVRTLQFLRAPSMLHDYHRMHAAAGGHLAATGEHYERILPEPVRLWLYRAAMERGYVETVVERFVVRPVITGARWCEALEPSPAKPDPQPARSNVWLAGTEEA